MRKKVPNIQRIINSDILLLLAFKASIQGQVGLASQHNSCEQPLNNTFEASLEASKYMHTLDISPSLHNFACTNTIKLETDFIGTLIYTLWLMSKDTCTSILKLF
jgi:hypothetical protein